MTKVTRCKLLVIAILAGALSTPAQDVRHWQYFEKRDDFTDEVTAMLIVADETGKFHLAVMNAKSTPVVALHTPIESKLRTDVDIEYRIDEGPIYRESWKFIDGTFGTSSPQAFLRNIRSGTRLRIRMKLSDSNGPVFVFDISGFGEQGRKIGL